MAIDEHALHIIGLALGPILVVACPEPGGTSGSETSAETSDGATGTSSGGEVDTDPTPAAGDPPPPELVGMWFDASWIATPDYFDPVSGSWNLPSGVGSSIEFFEDGTYARGARSEVAIGVCSDIAEVESYGVATFDGEQVTLSPNSGEVRTYNSCEPNDVLATGIDMTGGTYRWVRTGVMTLQLFDVTAPTHQIGPGAPGDPCTDGSECMGGFCVAFAGSTGYCETNCRLDVGCTELSHRFMSCAELEECVYTCTTPQGVILSADVQLCVDNCFGRANEPATVLWADYQACFTQTGCTFDDCPEVCASEYDACVAHDG